MPRWRDEDNERQTPNTLTEKTVRRLLNAWKGASAGREIAPPTGLLLKLASVNPKGLTHRQAELDRERGRYSNPNTLESFTEWLEKQLFPGQNRLKESA